MQVHDTRIPPQTPGPGRVTHTHDAVPDQTPADGITAGEREYFERLFPSSATEIRTHNVYARDGGTARPPIGGIVDRKG